MDLDSEDEIMSGDPQKLFAALSQEPSERACERIFDERSTLREILNRNELTLRARWNKKSGQQRRKVFISAYPEIPIIHRPDFEAARRESEQQRRRRTRFYDSFLLPSLNLEDLAKSQNLLLFLHSRARTDPDLFVNADFNSIHMGTVSGAIVGSYLNGYTMILSGQKSASTYGRLIPWDNDPGAFEKMLKGRGLQPRIGLLVLEIQQKKLRFLLQCAQTILHDNPPQLDGLGQSATITAPSTEESEWPSLVNEVLKAPYQAPDQFDVGRLRSFVSGKRSDAEDHIWSLREDPSYFKDTLYEWSERRQEKLLSTNGKPHPLLRRDEFWEHILRNIVMQAYGNLIIWSQLEKDVEHLTLMRQKYGDKIVPCSDLPEDYALALCHFSYQVDQHIKPAIGMWKRGMMASPPLRKHYVREPLDPNEPNKMILKARKPISHVEDPFLCLMEQLTRDDQIMFMGLENIVDELERLMRNDRKSRERLSSWLASVLSDLSLLAGLKRQIGLLWPGPSILGAVSIEEQEREHDKKSTLFNNILDIFQKGMRLAAVGNPLTKFNYPSEKRRTATTTQQMQEAERNLDRFWETVDDHVFRREGKPLTSILKGILPQRPIRRTEDWKEPERTGTELDVGPVITQFTQAGLEQRTQKPATPDAVPEPKQKMKTRGTPRAEIDALQAEESEPDPGTEDPVFTVSKRC